MLVMIDNKPIDLPSRFKAGDEMTANAANVLNMILLRRIRARLHYLLEKRELTPEEVPAKALSLVDMDLVPFGVAADLDDEDGAGDPIYAEALEIAKQLIVARMNKLGLPTPKNLDIHAKAAVDSQPQIRAAAQARVEARLKAAQQALEILQ
jgi:hypothetical protein